MAETKEFVKNYLDKIKEIKESLDKIGIVIESLPEASWKKSLQTSQMNYEKKVDAFLKSGEKLSAEQKTAIAFIRSGQATSAQISALSSMEQAINTENPTTLPEDEEGSKKKPSKSKH